MSTIKESLPTKIFKKMSAHVSDRKEIISNLGIIHFVRDSP